MAAALLDLEDVLKSKQETLTAQESNILLRCHSKALRAFTAGALIGGGGVWAATRKLTKFAPQLAVGAAAIAGLGGFTRSLESSVDRVLGMDGSRLQRELANVILNKYKNDPWTMRHLQRHFFQERVFDDAHADKPVIRWRYRNFFGDNVDHGQTTSESDSSDSHTSHNDSNTKMLPTKTRPANLQTNHEIELTEDPLDSIFGSMATVEDIHHPNTPSKPERASTRSHRRSHRRRRLHHRESLASKHAEPQLI